MAEKKAAEKKPAAKTATKTAKPAAKKETKTAAKPAAKKTTEKKPAVKKETKTAAKPAAKKPAEKKPAAKKPAEKKPAAKKQFITYRAEDRKWAVTIESGKKATKLFNTKAEAEEYAKGIAKNQGSKVVRKKMDGKFQKDKY